VIWFTVFDGPRRYVGAGYNFRLEKIMKKLIALAAIAFVLSAGAVATVIVNAQPVMAGFCDNPTANY
jgi:hypothetical protein